MLLTLENKHPVLFFKLGELKARFGCEASLLRSSKEPQETVPLQKILQLISANLN